MGGALPRESDANRFAQAGGEEGDEGDSEKRGFRGEREGVASPDVPEGGKKQSSGEEACAHDAPTGVDSIRTRSSEAERRGYSEDPPASSPGKWPAYPSDFHRGSS